MGQKTHPYGFRVGITEDWKSRWFAKKDFSKFIEEDYKIRRYIQERLKDAEISKIEIAKTTDLLTITISTARPGLVIGRKGEAIDKLKEEIKLLTGRTDVLINIEEVKVAELDANVIAQRVAKQIEQRVPYRRAMRRIATQVMQVGAQGVKIECSGRLMGVEIARSEWYREGKIPLQTVKANVDFAHATAKTKFGVIGIKVWIYKGDVTT